MKKPQKMYQVTVNPWKSQIGCMVGQFTYNGREMSVIKILKQKNDGEYYRAFATVQKHEYKQVGA